MIQQVDSNQTELEYQKEMEEVEDVIQRSILHRKKDTDFQIGIGKSVEGYQRLKESYHEASRAIKYIDIIRLVTGDKNKSVVHYSNLGFFQIFGKIDDIATFINPLEILCSFLLVFVVTLCTSVTSIRYLKKHGITQLMFD